MEITRDLVFGVMALQKSLLEPTLLARAMAEQCKTGTPLPELLVEKAWLSADQCAGLNQALDAELHRHGNDLQRVLDAFGSGPSCENASNHALNSSAEDEQTLDHHATDSAAPHALDAKPPSTKPPSTKPPSTKPPSTKPPATKPPATHTANDGPGHPTDGEPAGGEETDVQAPGGTEDDLQQTLDMVPSGAGVDLGSGSSLGDIQKTVEFTPEQCSRYTLTRIYGEGGLGQVWLAIDPNLNREVALKNIRPGKDDALSRQRLIREAQITGQLEHPNIIPIYELEHASPNATPYYTMRFLRGKTLQQKIAKYQQHRKQGNVDPLELPELLSAFIDICHAIAYAASRGVMHRDLKPQNIMLGDFGEVLVLDWGLAKKIDDQELTAGQQRGPVQLTPASGVLPTMAGNVMGSPAYMAPEQADGRIDLMDPRTDIYGLGAILFSILTGKGPHRGERTGNSAKDTRDLLRRISTGETPRARDFDPSVPRPLEAICLHAMAKDRELRYQSATDLARDVQRYLADEPVTVYVEPWQQRTWRWVRRHRAWTQSVAAALVLTLVVSVVAAVVVDQARRSETRQRQKADDALVAKEAALAEVEAARQESTRRFHQARRAVDESLTGISQALEDYPGAQALRTQLLEKAARDYEEFASQRSDEPELQIAFALALVRLGDVRRLLADFAAAEQAYQRAIRQFNEILRRTPADSAVQISLAQCYNALGLLHVTAGSTPEAAEASDAFAAASRAYDAATDLLTRQRDETKATVEFRRTHAKTMANRGVLLSYLADAEAAIGALRAAAVEFEDLANHSHASADRSDLAKTRISIANLLVETGRTLEAEQELQRSQDCYEELVRQNPGDVDFLQGLADTRITRGNALQALGRPADRLALYRDAITDYTALVKTRPDVPKYRQGLVATLINHALVLNTLGRNVEAKQQAMIALERSMDLVNENPIADNHAKEAYCRKTLGLILRDLQALSEAELAFATAAEKAAELIAAFPDQDHYHRLRGEVLNNLGTVCLLTADYPAARQIFIEARSEFNQSLEIAAKNVMAREGRAWSLAFLGDTLRHLERQEEAKTFYEQALQAFRENSDAPQREFQLAHFLIHCQDESLREPAEAGVIADRIARQSPTNSDYLVLEAAAWYRQGEWQRCLTKLDEAAIVHLQGKNAIDFWRAMALHQLAADNPEAGRVFQRACNQMDQWAPGDLKLIRLRNEAAALLEASSSPQPDADEDNGQ